MHLYEGRAAAAQIVGVSLVAYGLYRFSGTLWIPIVAHAVFDMLQIRLALAVLGPDAGGGANSEDGGGDPAPSSSAGPVQFLAQPDAELRRVLFDGGSTEAR